MPLATTDETSQVIAFWTRLGLPGLVDVHTHFMPERVLAKVWSYFDRVGGATDTAWPIAYRVDEDERLRRLRGFGVRTFTSMVYPHKAGMAEWLNTWAADFAARTADCLRTATFFPEPGAGTYVAKSIADGTRIFKAHLQVGAYDPADPELTPVWGALQDSGTPIVAHCGSGPYPGEFTGPGPISKVLAAFPRLRLIVAHMGLPEYAEFLDLADRYNGVHLDTTMAFTDFTEQIAPFPDALRPRLADAGERILLGTDFPNIPYRYLHQLESLDRLGLGDDWLRAVCYHNAVRVFGL
jgi:hypothetical protein